jgi:hypothetical protein
MTRVGGPCGTSMNRVLTIPLAIGPHHLSAALLRSRLDFTARELQLARLLQPVRSGLHGLRNSSATTSTNP